MLVSEKAKKHGIAVTLAETTILDPSYGAIVLQYNLRLQKGLECGGAYLKYLRPQVGLLMINQKQFSICSYKCLSLFQSLVATVSGMQNHDDLSQLACGAI